jgi:class 3 adenylate cyclase
MVCTVTTDLTGGTAAMSVSQNVTRTNGSFARGRFSAPRARERSQRGTSARCTAWRWSPDRTHVASCIVLVDGDTSVGGQPPRRRDAGRFLTTVLITDIVDSTSMAMRLGDRRWRDVLVDHYMACRSHVERNGGELVNTTGDGVVAIFDGPAHAICAAIAIQAAARASGMAVRAGVHAGECERVGHDLAGIAVHIAARVCALAGGGEVVTTGTVRDLATGSMLSFEPRGPRKLKGVPDRWPVFCATAQ